MRHQTNVKTGSLNLIFFLSLDEEEMRKLDDSDAKKETHHMTI